MNTAELQDYLYRNIPLSQAMAVGVLLAEPQCVRLAAPLAPNINHQDTVFGGSASTLAILSAWTMLHVALKHAGLPNRIVIQRNAVNYEAPITDAFEAEAQLAHDQQWERFLATLRKRGRARITIQSKLYCHSAQVASFEGDYVAFLES